MSTERVIRDFISCSFKGQSHEEKIVHLYKFFAISSIEVEYPLLLFVKLYPMPTYICKKQIKMERKYESQMTIIYT